LTTLLASYGIDSLIVGRRYLPQMVSAVLPATKILSEISYYSNIAGLVLLVPAVITGFHEWWEIAKYKGENKFVDGVVSLFAFYVPFMPDASPDCRKYSPIRTAHSTSRPSTVS
jgi:ABC-type transport system involved in cytochrome c biogenesis permease subunit